MRRGVFVLNLLNRLHCFCIIFAVGVYAHVSLVSFVINAKLIELNILRISFETTHCFVNAYKYTEVLIESTILG